MKNTYYITESGRMAPWPSFESKSAAKAELAYLVADARQTVKRRFGCVTVKRGEGWASVEFGCNLWASWAIVKA